MKSEFGMNREMVVTRWRVNVYKVRDSKNGDYTILKGVTGARKNEDGYYEGGTYVDVLIPKASGITANSVGLYLVSGVITWGVFEDCNGVKHNNCSIWADDVRPYTRKPKGEKENG